MCKQCPRRSHSPLQHISLRGKVSLFSMRSILMFYFTSSVSLLLLNPALEMPWSARTWTMMLLWYPIQHSGFTQFQCGVCPHACYPTIVLTNACRLFCCSPKVFWGLALLHLSHAACKLQHGAPNRSARSAAAAGTGRSGGSSSFPRVWRGDFEAFPHQRSAGAGSTPASVSATPSPGSQVSTLAAAGLPPVPLLRGTMCKPCCPL